MRLQECFYEVRQADDQGRSVVEQITQKNTDFLSGSSGGVTLSYVCPHYHRFPRGDYIWWFSTRHRTKNSVTGGVQRAAAKVEAGRRDPCTRAWRERHGRTCITKFVEINKAVNVRHPGWDSRAKTLCRARDAKERGDAYCDQTSEQKIVSRDVDRQDLGGKHTCRIHLSLLWGVLFT